MGSAYHILPTIFLGPVKVLKHVELGARKLCQRDITLSSADLIFEINDFTAATEWENFIDDIENILRNWRICESTTDTKVTSWQLLIII